MIPIVMGHLGLYVVDGGKSPSFSTHFIAPFPRFVKGDGRTTSRGAACGHMAEMKGRIRIDGER